MTITLTLTPAQEVLLRALAAQTGQTPEAVLLAPLHAQDAPRNGSGNGHALSEPALPLDPVLADIIAEAERTEFTPGVRPPGAEAE